MRFLRSGATLVALAACTTHVKLTVRNPQPVDQQVRVNILDDHSVKSSSIELGMAAANVGEVSHEFDVKHDYQIQIVGMLPGAVEASPSPPKTVASKPDPLEYTYDLTLPQYLADDAAAGQIQAAFEKLGPKMPGFDPLSIADALASWFGSLIVVPEPQQGGPNDTVLFQLRPGQFGPPPTPADQFKYPEAVSQQTVKVTKSGSAKAAASFAAFSLAVEGESAEVLEVNWLMTGYGMVQRADPPDWNYIDATNQLSPSLKDALFTVLSENPKARVIYVDKLYVFRSATFNIREGRRLTAGTQIGALSVVTASGAYSFESSNIKVKSREASVLNVAGTPVVLRTVEQRPGSNATISTLALKASPSKGVAGSIPTPTLAPNWKKVTLLPTFERSSVILNPRSPTAKTDATRTP